MWSVICVYVHAMIIFTSLKNVLNFIAQPWGLFLQMNVLGLLCVCGLVILPTPVQVSTDHSSRGAYPHPSPLPSRDASSCPWMQNCVQWKCNGELIKIATRNRELFSKVERVREGKPSFKSSHQNKKKIERNAKFHRRNPRVRRGLPRIL